MIAHQGWAIFIAQKPSEPHTYKSQTLLRSIAKSHLLAKPLSPKKQPPASSGCFWMWSFRMFVYFWPLHNFFIQKLPL